MKPIRIVVHGGPAAAHIADALHWLNGSQRASNLHHVSKLFGENEVYTEWIKEPADVREVPAAASSDPMLVSFIQNEVNKVFRARVACHGLDLPENVPPGVLAELVTVARATLVRSYQSGHDGMEYAKLELTLQKLGPVSPEPEGYFEKCRRETAEYHAAKEKPVSPEPENKQLAFYSALVRSAPVFDDPHGMLVEPPEPGTTFLRLQPTERELLLGLVEVGIATHDDLPPGDNIFRRKSEEFLPIYQALKEKLEDSPGDMELPDTCCPECMHDCYGEKPDRHCLECGWHENPRKLDELEDL